MAEREKISCIVLTKDAGEDIAACLESVRWADEIIVVDDLGDGATREAARRYTDKVYERRGAGYPAQRDFGIRRALHRWVLCLDADERVGPELMDEVRARLSEPPSVSGFYLRRITIALGRQVSHSVWRETNALRLFDREKVSFDLTLRCREEARITGPAGALTHRLLQYGCRDIEGYCKTVDLWSALDARDLMAKGMRIPPGAMPYYLFLKPLALFCDRFVMRSGFRDGFAGLVVASLSSFTCFLSYAKALESRRVCAGGTISSRSGDVAKESLPVPRIGVVVVTYNNAAQLGALLGDLASQTRSPDEVIVIDNASSDDTPAVAKSSKVPVRYVRLSSNRGSAGGFREGLRLACESNDMVWLLDDDVFVEPEALRAVAEGMRLVSGSGKPGAVRSWGKGSAPFAGPAKATGFAWRGTLIPREVVADIGLPREEYFLYGEDTEYSLRMIRKGYDVYWIPASRVIERTTHGRITLRLLWLSTTAYTDAFRLYYATRNQLSVYLAYGDLGGLFRSFLYIVRMMVLLGMADRRRAGERLRAICRGVWDGLRGDLGKNSTYVPSGDRSVP